MKKSGIVLLFGLLAARGFAQHVTADAMDVAGKITAQNYVGGVNGSVNVMQYGAKCDGVTDDAAAFNSAIAALGSRSFKLVIPNTGIPCVVSQINATNWNNRLTIAGDNGPIQFTSVITCNEERAGSGVCLDLTGSQYVDIENIRFQYGRNPPRAVIRMGKSTGGNGNNGSSQIIHTANLDIECAGNNYGVYNNGAEVWHSNGDKFGGCKYPIVLSDAARCGDVSTPWTSCRSTIREMSMTSVQLFTPVIVAGVAGGVGVLFDTGAGGSVEDVALYGGYGQTVGGVTALFGDKGTGPIRGFKLYNFRDEPQGTTAIAPMVKFTNVAQNITLQGKIAANARPTTASLQFGIIQDAFLDVMPGDTNKNYASPFITCTSGPSTEVHVYAKAGGGALPNSCPGDVEFFTGISTPSLAISSTNGSALLCSGDLPTITSGFNNGSIAAGANGSCSFSVTVGTGVAGSTGALSLATPASGWNCFATNNTRPALISETANTAGSVTLTNYGTTWAATNWTNGDVILISCVGH